MFRTASISLSRLAPVLLLISACAYNAAPGPQAPLKADESPAGEAPPTPSEATPETPPEVVQRLCGECHLGPDTRGWEEAGMSRLQAAKFIRNPNLYSMPGFAESELSNEELETVLDWLTGLGTVV